MKCFKIFDSKAKKRGKSSTELGQQNPSSTKPPTRLVKSTGSISSPRTIPELYREKGHSLKKFSFSELRIATNNFDWLLKIGEGGFGSVYRGSRILLLLQSRNSIENSMQYYPSLNRSRCCTKCICTECFLQMKYRGVKTKEEKGQEQIEEQRVKKRRYE